MLSPNESTKPIKYDYHIHTNVKLHSCDAIIHGSLPFQEDPYMCASIALAIHSSMRLLKYVEITKKFGPKTINYYQNIFLVCASVRVYVFVCFLL